MGRRNRREPILIKNIEIIDTANKGRSVAKYDGRAIFINKGVPGDICDIKVFRRKRKFWEASIDTIHTYSNKRTKLFYVRSECKLSVILEYTNIQCFFVKKNLMSMIIFVSSAEQKIFQE